MDWLLVEQGSNPSTDCFVLPRLYGLQVTRAHLGCPPSVGVVPKNVIFVRYITTAWRRWVELHRNQFAQVAYFMDDDLFDLRASAGLPLRYRWKIYAKAYRHQSWLESIGARLWLSSTWLAQKYRTWHPEVLTPDTPYTDARRTYTVFYHGSASHHAEIQWLVSIVEQVVQQDESLNFEVIGDRRVKALFAHIPRVRVLHPMSWNTYRSMLGEPGRLIGLAPLLDYPFNQARSYTKFFDITQAGAVGIYADHPVYRKIVRHQQNGLLVPMGQQAWVNTILRLSKHRVLREQLLNSARLTILQQNPANPAENNV